MFFFLFEKQNNKQTNKHCFSFAFVRNSFLLFSLQTIQLRNNHLKIYNLLIIVTETKTNNFTTISEDISDDMAKLPDNPMKQTSFSLSKGNWFTHKWWMASNVRNYAIIQGVMDILEKRGYQLKAADKVFFYCFFFRCPFCLISQKNKIITLIYT